MMTTQEKPAQQALKNTNYFVWCVQQGKKAMREDRVRRIYASRPRAE
jgi:hypothetical protein